MVDIGGIGAATRTHGRAAAGLHAGRQPSSVPDFGAEVDALAAAPAAPAATANTTAADRAEARPAEPRTSTGAPRREPGRVESTTTAPAQSNDPATRRAPVRDAADADHTSGGDAEARGTDRGAASLETTDGESAERDSADDQAQQQGAVAAAMAAGAPAVIDPLAKLPGGATNANDAADDGETVAAAGTAADGDSPNPTGAARSARQPGEPAASQAGFDDAAARAARAAAEAGNDLDPAARVSDAASESNLTEIVGEAAAGAEAPAAGEPAVASRHATGAASTTATATLAAAPGGATETGATASAPAPATGEGSTQTFIELGTALSGAATRSATPDSANGAASSRDAGGVRLTNANAEAPSSGAALAPAMAVPASNAGAADAGASGSDDASGGGRSAADRHDGSSNQLASDSVQTSTPAAPFGTASPLVAPLHSAPAIATAHQGVELLFPPQSAPATLAFAPGAELAGEVTAGIVQAIRLQWARGEGEARIQLDPAQYGELRVTLQVSDGQVHASIESDTPAVREWLQANHHTLVDGLARRDLTLDRFDVSHVREQAGRQSDPRRESQSRRERPAPRRPWREPESGATFEVVA